MIFGYQVPVRWDDLDAQGHVNNAVIIDYLQEARVRFLLEGPNAHLLGGGVIVVSHSVDYLGPGLVGAPIWVELAVAEVGWSRFVLRYRLSQNGTPIAQAVTVLCVYDFETARPTRLMPAERDWFLAVAEDDFIDLAASRPGGELSAGAHEFEFRVRWSDLDSYGHVNNTKFFTYLQEARVAYTEAEAPVMARAAAEGVTEFVWLLAHQDVSYLQPIQHRLAPYLVRTKFVRAGRTSLTLAAEIVDGDGHRYASATTVLVCADRDLRPTPLPNEVRLAVARQTA